jgi:hypothetical protein
MFLALLVEMGPAISGDLQRAMKGVPGHGHRTRGSSNLSVFPAVPTMFSLPPSPLSLVKRFLIKERHYLGIYKSIFVTNPAES